MCQAYLDMLCSSCISVRAAHFYITSQIFKNWSEESSFPWETCVQLEQLPDWVASTDSVNSFKNRIDRCLIFNAQSTIEVIILGRLKNQPDWHRKSDGWADSWLLMPSLVVNLKGKHWKCEETVYHPSCYHKANTHSAWVNDPWRASLDDLRCHSISFFPPLFHFSSTPPKLVWSACTCFLCVCMPIPVLEIFVLVATVMIVRVLLDCNI